MLTHTDSNPKVKWSLVEALHLNPSKMNVPSWFQQANEIQTNQQQEQEHTSAGGAF